MIETIQRADEVDRRCQVEPTQVKAWLDAGEDFSFLDVRPPEEIAISRIEAAEGLDFADSDRYMELPKDHRIVFACRTARAASTSRATSSATASRTCAPCRAA